ncbi:MAG: trimethylamine corrinoid protein 2 [Lachnospiraceae bacterium]|nr:trimethylamine corrinoid protein 2 [Lachnospiraceae bacterium]MDD3616387.1 trimethylamine corrinoid protein 2 [Lachnospiraceae bacterium]
MQYKEDWQGTKQRFDDYWNRDNSGRPLMRVVGVKPEFDPYHLPDHLHSKDMEDKYLNPDRIVNSFRNYCETHKFLGESFPNLNADFGPGSIAGYLGSEIVFKPDTVWFNSCVDDWATFPKLEFNPENKWFKKHIWLFEECKKRIGDDFPIAIPDLMENLDVLASLRGTQVLLNDLMDDMVEETDVIVKRVQEVTDLYQQYYDAFYKYAEYEGGSAYTVFQIFGSGKTQKLQCDFSAMLSSNYFKTFVLDSLKQATQPLDHVLYHLDGPDAIRHMDDLMTVEGIDALQWTSGDYGPDGTLPEWDVIYDKARAAGKGLWVKVYSGNFEDWIRNTDRIVKKYGSKGLYLYFDDMPLKQAEELMAYAEKNWSDVKGTF